MLKFIELVIGLIAFLVLMLLLTDFIKKIARMTVKSEAADSPKVVYVPTEERGVKMVRGRSPFVEQSYRDQISLSLADVVDDEEEDLTRDYMERCNATSMAPDEDSPYVQNIRDYSTFKRSLDTGRVEEKDKRLIQSEIEKVVGTEFEKYYRKELDRLVLVLSQEGSMPSEEETPADNDEVVSDEFDLGLEKSRVI